MDEYRMLTDLLDACDRLHDGMVEVADVAALLFAASRALTAWPYVGELVAVEKDVRHIAVSGDGSGRGGRALVRLQPLRERIAGELRAVGRRRRQHRDPSRTVTVPADDERLLERLIIALAAQAEGSALRPGAVEALAELSREDAGAFFGIAGLQVHYCEPEPVGALIEAVSAAQRRESDPAAALRPGDAVRIAEVPPSMADYDHDWVRETTFFVRYVGDDGTVDVQPELSEDYVINTVPAGALERARTWQGEGGRS